MSVPKKRPSGLTASVTRLSPCVACSVPEESFCLWHRDQGEMKEYWN